MHAGLSDFSEVENDEGDKGKFFRVSAVFPYFLRNITGNTHPLTLHANVRTKNRNATVTKTLEANILSSRGRQLA